MTSCVISAVDQDLLRVEGDDTAHASWCESCGTDTLPLGSLFQKIQSLNTVELLIGRVGLASQDIQGVSSSDTGVSHPLVWHRSAVLELPRDEAKTDDCAQGASLAVISPGDVDREVFVRGESKS